MGDQSLAPMPGRGLALQAAPLGCTSSPATYWRCCTTGPSRGSGLQCHERFRAPPSTSSAGRHRRLCRRIKCPKPVFRLSPSPLCLVAAPGLAGPGRPRAPGPAVRWAVLPWALWAPGAVPGAFSAPGAAAPPLRAPPLRVGDAHQCPAAVGTAVPPPRTPPPPLAPRIKPPHPRQRQACGADFLPGPSVPLAPRQDKKWWPEPRSLQAYRALSCPVTLPPLPWLRLLVALCSLGLWVLPWLFRPVPRPCRPVLVAQGAGNFVPSSLLVTTFCSGSSSQQQDSR